MVYIKRWADFHAQCTDLFERAPDRTRYLIKGTPSQQWLVLKVTDDQTCLKFRARSAIIINRFEAFTRDMTALMAGLPAPSAASVIGAAVAAAAGTTTGASTAQSMDLDAKPKANNTSDGQSTQQQQQQQSNTGSGGAAKKKKKKGKK